MANQFDAFAEKMRAENLSESSIAAFKHSFTEYVDGSAGSISEATISPVKSLPSYESLGVNVDSKLLEQSVVLKLNGGLGTSMGLDKAKSLLKVKGESTFLDLTAKQVESMRAKFKLGVKFMLMNSFNTSSDTLSFLAKYPTLLADPTIELMQNKAPKIDKETNKPATWPINKHLEWCPPGHGDLYTALYGSGKLQDLLSQGYKYMFVSNSDNLGATMSLE
jgi:UDP-N-acetylglucosamine pyrophosphorylase